MFKDKGAQSNVSNATATNPRIQPAADYLYELTGMPVVATNNDFNVLASSVQSIADSNRTATIMERRTPKSARRYVVRLGVDLHSRHNLLPIEPDVGIEFERWCMSLQRPGGNLYFWLLNSRKNHVDNVERFSDRVVNGIESMLDSVDIGGDVSEHLLVRRLVDEDALERAEALTEAGISPSSIGEYEVAVVRGIEATVTPELDGLLISQIREALASPFALVGVANDQLLILTKTSSRGRTLDKLAQLTSRYSPGELTIGIAPARAGENSIADAQERAIFLARIGALPESPRIMEWEKAGSWKTLYRTEFGSLGIDEIRPGLRYLTAERPQLANSARVYLESSSADEAAQRLFVHRTTLYHHLSKVNEVLGDGWDKGWERAGVHAALQLARL